MPTSTCIGISSGTKHRRQRDPRSTVLLLRAYGFNVEALSHEGKPVVPARNAAAVREDQAEGMGGHVAKAKEVHILRRADRIAEPHQQKRRALHDEAVRPRGYG